MTLWKLKAKFSDIETDEDMEMKIAQDEDRFYTFLCLRWYLVDNTLTPNMFFNLDKKNIEVQLEPRNWWR